MITSKKLIKSPHFFLVAALKKTPEIGKFFQSSKMNAYKCQITVLKFQTKSDHHALQSMSSNSIVNISGTDNNAVQIFIQNYQIFLIKFQTSKNPQIQLKVQSTLKFSPQFMNQTKYIHSCFTFKIWTQKKDSHLIAISSFS